MFSGRNMKNINTFGLNYGHINRKCRILNFKDKQDEIWCPIYYGKYESCVGTQ